LLDHAIVRPSGDQVGNVPCPTISEWLPSAAVIRISVEVGESGWSGWCIATSHRPSGDQSGLWS
jgi:hypothetical protein